VDLGLVLKVAKYSRSAKKDIHAFHFAIGMKRSWTTDISARNEFVDMVEN
jgi:hypothetical protein